MAVRHRKGRKASGKGPASSVPAARGFCNISFFIVVNLTVVIHEGGETSNKSTNILQLLVRHSTYIDTQTILRIRKREMVEEAAGCYAG